MPNDLNLTFPRGIDSTMRKTFVACPTKFLYEYCYNRRKGEPGPDLHAGKAFASGLEAARKAHWQEDLSPDEALAEGIKALLTEWGSYEPPEGHPKSLERMVGALEAYFSHYGWDTDHIQPLMREGKPAVEFSFAIPLPETHPETGEPLLYTGRFDMLGLYNGSIFVVDEKTTKQLGASWSRQWNMRSQFTGYCFAAEEYGHPVAGAIIRGISILKTKYGHAEAIQYRPKHVIDQWYKQLIRDIREMKEAWRHAPKEHWDLALDDACSQYFGCSYERVCLQPPERKLSVLAEDTIEYIWDPLADLKLQEEGK